MHGSDLIGREEGQEQGGCLGLEEDLLAGLDLLGEPSGGSDHATRGGSTAGTAHHAFDPAQLAGAVAAAGVLLPHALPPRGTAGGASASGAGSSGGASGAATPVAASGAGGLQLAAALEQQRAAAASEDVGCVAAVTLSFMHQPGKHAAAAAGLSGELSCKSPPPPPPLLFHTLAAACLICRYHLRPCPSPHPHPTPTHPPTHPQ
jgi:hypothetical protein